jgi:hypothetical protein
VTSRLECRYQGAAQGLKNNAVAPGQADERIELPEPRLSQLPAGLDLTGSSSGYGLRGESGEAAASWRSQSGP